MRSMRFSSQYVQRDRRYRYGLWGVYDTRNSSYIKFGSKGKMNQIAKLLNEND